MSNEHLLPMPEGFDPDDLDAEIAAQAAAEDEQYGHAPQFADEQPAEAPELPTLSPEEIEAALHRNYLGDAELFIKRYRGRFVYDAAADNWYRFNCTRWIPDTAMHCAAAVTDLANDFERSGKRVGKELAEAEGKGLADKELKRLEKRRDAFFKRAARLRDPGPVSKVLTKATQGPAALGLEGDAWNQHPHLFVAKNCVLDLRSGEAVDTRAEDYLNQASPVVWRGLHHRSKLWEKFLHDVFEGDLELISYLQRCAGYWLTGLNVIQDFWCLHGARGRNGKGVFFRALRAIMGDYFSMIGSHLLLDRKNQGGGGPNPELVSLRFRRLAVASESSKRSRFSDEAVKGLTGGDPITCRGMYSGEMITFTPSFKLLFATNRIPSVDGGDQAFRARLKIIPFRCQFLPGMEPDTVKRIYPMDPELELKLHQPDELSGILAWCVEGAIEFYKAMALPAPASVRLETDEFMNSQDEVGEFIEQCLIITDAPPLGQGTAAAESKTQAKDVYAAYCRWLKEEKGKPEKFLPSQHSFGGDLKGRQEIYHVSPANKVFYNVLIKDDWLPLEGGQGSKKDW